MNLVFLPDFELLILPRSALKHILNIHKSTYIMIQTLCCTTNLGFTRHVGTAIGDRRSKQSKRKLVTFGFAPWGVVANKEQLIGENVCNFMVTVKDSLFTNC
jgi:hypothetical protein